MNKKVFISYSEIDRRKKDILVKEIDKWMNLKHIVIADKRQTNLYLSEKVIRGFSLAHYVIVILTKNSIQNQWVNQEIGYAKSLEKLKKIKIYEIVEENIIPDLKGFIHNQKDLPYKFYSFPNNTRRENLPFVKQAKILLKVVENDIRKSLGKKPLVRLKQNPSIKISTTKHGIVVNRLSDTHLELTIDAIIDNSTAKSFAIREIELLIKNPDLKSAFYETDTMKFNSTYFSDGHIKSNLKINNFILERNSIRKTKLKFESLGIYKGREAIVNIRDVLNRNINNIESIKATINNKFKVDIEIY